MAVTISADKYPAFNSDTGVSGKRRVIYINYGTGATEAKPVWSLLGGITSQTVNWGTSVSTQNTKDTGYWPSGAVTGKTCELTCDVMFKRDNEAQAAIENFLLDDDVTSEKGALMFAFVDLDTKDYTVMKMIPTKWTEKAEAKDVITKSLTAIGVGKPEVKSGFTVTKPAGT